MSDSLPPRIRVALPGTHPGRLVRWRQDDTGQWWAEVTVHVPADAVQQIPGEDYTRVPREPAPPRYVMVVPKGGGERHGELHRAGCFAIPAASTSTLRVTVLPDAAAARGMLRFDDTSQCPACRPFPDAP